LRAELLAGQQFHAGGGTANLSAQEWIDRWREFRALTPTGNLARAGAPDDGAAVGQSARDTSEESVQLVRAENFVWRFDQADTHLRAGHIEEANLVGQVLVPLVRKTVDRSPDDPTLRHSLALALVLAADPEGYREACAATVARFSGFEGDFMVEAARACLIAPSGTDNLLVARRLAAKALTREAATPWCLYVLALADYRLGKYEDSVAHLAKSLKLATGWQAAPLNYPVMAMAHARLGHEGEARRWLEKAHGRGPQATTNSENMSSAVWWDRVEFRLLLREADALIPDAIIPSVPFAP
jgi:hypothetical protein